MTADNGSRRRRVARPRAPAAALTAPRTTPSTRAGRLPAARRSGRTARPGRPVRPARPRRRGVSAGRQAADGPRRRPPGRRCRRRRQWRRGRTGVGQGPLAAAQPPAPGARRAAAGGAHRRRPSARTSMSPTRAPPKQSQTALDRGSSRKCSAAWPSRVYGRPRLRRRRGDRRGARHQRRPGQADRQAAAPVRGGRRPPAHPGQQCRDSGLNLPFLHRHGAEAFRGQGTSMSPGTFLATITGAGRPAALYEIPHGAGIRRAARLPRRASRSGARGADGRLLRRSAEPRHS